MTIDIFESKVYNQESIIYYVDKASALNTKIVQLTKNDGSTKIILVEQSLLKCLLKKFCEIKADAVASYIFKNVKSVEETTNMHGYAILVGTNFLVNNITTLATVYNKETFYIENTVLLSHIYEHIEVEVFIDEQI